MTAIIPRKNEYPDWDSVDSLLVEQYAWGGEYRPDTTAKIVLEENQGFRIRMKTMESEPVALYTENHSPVHEDSCMEFFVNFTPDRPDSGYLNFEVNANGAIHCGYGPGRGNRLRLTAMGFALPEVTILRGGESWACEYFVPFEVIGSVFGKKDFADGDMIRANFYKCGDKTPIPHFGSWNPIVNPTPDFHRPECFGTLIIGDRCPA